MNGKKIIFKNQDNIIALLLTGLLAVFLAVRYDFYHDLNDDVWMQNILSGAYTGVPESRNIQMLYPLSFIISLLYRMFPALPIYGMLMVFCQLLCIYLMVRRSLQFRSNLMSKLLFALLAGFFVLGVFLQHMIFVQYTVTCALLASTAAFLFLTTSKQELQGLSAGAFVRKNSISIGLVIFAFAMRSEMLLLLLPLIGVAGICKWSMENVIFSKENMQKYFLTFGVIMAGIGAVFLVNSVAYGGQEWREFMTFFDERTQLYDFQEILPYEGNEAFYESVGLSEEERDYLLEEYNFGMAKQVDAQLLRELSAESQSKRALIGFLDRWKDGFSNYVYRTLHREGDYPFNLLVILSYLSVTIAGIWYGIANGRQTMNRLMMIVFRLFFLGGVRTGLWMYILVRRRDPARITHSLYLMELFILWAVLIVICSGIDAKLYGKIKATLVFPLIIGIVLTVCVPGLLKDTDKKYRDREMVNQTQLAFAQYRMEHKDNFYWMEVYASVDYSEKLFRREELRPDNYDIMGGWVCKSPLYEKKLSYFSINNMEESLLEQETVYFVAELSTGPKQLIRYFNGKNVTVEAVLIDTIHNTLGIYQIKKGE